KKSKGVVHLLNVVELPVIHDPVIMPVATFELDFMKDLKARAQRLFDRMNDKHNTSGVEVKKEVTFGAPSTQIVEIARKKRASIIVMGTHGATGIKEYFVGSNAEKVVRTSPMPVLIVK